MSYIPESPPKKSAFGDSLVMEPQPRVALKAVYGVLSNAETFTATGGGATTSDSEFVLTTGTSAGGYGVLWSRRPLVYIPGIGAECRITGQFTTGVASSLQAVGFFNANDGMLIGYNGTSFGVMHRHGGRLEIRELQITTGATSGGNCTVTLNGTALAIAVTNSSIETNAHEIEQALIADATLGAAWHFQHIGDVVVCVAKGNGARSGTYSIAAGSTGIAGSFTQDVAGNSATEDWTAQANWNVSTASWFTPTYNNIFKMEFAFLGYGPLKYSIFNPTTRDFELVHVVDWPGQSGNQVNMLNPSLRPGWVAASLGSTTALTVKGSSASAMLQGNIDVRRVFGETSLQTSVASGTTYQMLSLIVRREFNGAAANAVVNIDKIRVGSGSSKGGRFYVYRNPTTSGATVHQYVDETESICLVDTTAGITITDTGRTIGAAVLAAAGSAEIDLQNLDIELQAGDELVIAGVIPSGAAADLSASIIWDEKI